MSSGDLITHVAHPFLLSRSPGRAILAITLVLGAFAAFVLPFLMPVTAVPIYSTAWLGGADNRAATAGLAIIASVVLIMTVLQNRNSRQVDVPQHSDAKIDRKWLYIFAALITVWTLFWGFAIVRSGLRVGETNYFLEQTRNAAGIGLAQPMRIYRDLEFPYGPLLLEPAVWLWRLLGSAGISVATCYVLTLTVWNVLGLFFIWFSLNQLPMPGWARRLLFLVCLFESLHPLFGPNYSLGKFALPMAALLWANAMTPVRRIVALAIGLFVTLLVSPELALGQAAAVVALSLAGAARKPSEQRIWLSALMAIPVACVGFLALYGTVFLDRLSHASGGALNLIIQPLPDILIFCFAVIWVAPVAVGIYLGRYKHAESGLTDGSGKQLDSGPILLALFVLGLGFLPGALGRSDPLHIFFNGLPFLVLSMVGIRRLPVGARKAWAAAMILLALQVQAANYEMYARSLAAVLSAQRHPVTSTLDVARVALDTGGSPVAAPALYGISIPDELALRKAHLLVVDPAPGLAEIWDGKTEQQHIERLRGSAWALLPKQNYLISERLSRIPVERSGSLLKRLLQGTGHALLGFNYPEHHAPFVVGLATQKEIESDWAPVGDFGSLVLYKRMR